MKRHDLEIKARELLFKEKAISGTDAEVMHHFLDNPGEKFSYKELKTKFKADDLKYSIQRLEMAGGHNSGYIKTVSKIGGLTVSEGPLMQEFKEFLRDIRTRVKQTSVEKVQQDMTRYNIFKRNL